MIPETQYLFLRWFYQHIPNPFVELKLDILARGLKWRYISKLKNTTFTTEENPAEMMWWFLNQLGKPEPSLRPLSSAPDDPEEIEQRFLELITSLVKEIE